MFIAKLKNDIYVEKNDTTWPAGHLLTKDGVVQLFDQPFFEDIYEWFEVEYIHSSVFELIKKKKTNV